MNPDSHFLGSNSKRLGSDSDLLGPDSDFFDPDSDLLGEGRGNGLGRRGALCEGNGEGGRDRGLADDPI